MAKSFVFVIVLLVLYSCAANRKYDLSKISMGMSKSQVIKMLGKKPRTVVGAKQYPKGVVEVLQYKRREPWLGITTNNTYLYFLNDTLRKYGPPSSWEAQADSVYHVSF